MFGRLILLLGPLLSLSSCSYVYEVRATLVDGALVFASDKDWFRERCVRVVEVVATSREKPPEAAPGDDLSRVSYGTYWRNLVGYHCKNRFPVAYGKPLVGEPLDADRQTGLVSPKPLRAGVEYEVHTVSGAAGYGGGRFVIKPDGSVANIVR